MPRTDEPPHPIDAEGTPESTWLAWPPLARRPAFDLSGIRSAVVVAPHPDDEVLGFGGGLALLAESGARLRIVAVTDGDASHPNSPTLARGALVRRRHEERRAALRRLGAHDTEVVRLGLPDGGVAAAEAEVATRLNDLCAGFDLCLAPWEADLHPDHDATGRAAKTASAAAGTPLARYPVWMWHWARPDQPEVPWDTAHRIALPPHVRRRKAAAIDCFTTQIAPLSEHPDDAAILTPEMLAHFTRDAETVFR
ncbi:LmbE family N-acetylglucosaminyl deacetylase [Murinocardiopsis flavida]|uniref:LmbE family N-acetylglucosaminyl deacetylase n=1 Tax=Murinocardiopsis flavida TaxID=645275 RepID=A0A2P8CR90_9ACTN|nr:PIG-L family deacetylase [Murinocardiopsis flavida]PSK87487.1 LmbE family N-acetylglucosaminyl deacetylase [Murinocardiopsis flavida]